MFQNILNYQSFVVYLHYQQRINIIKHLKTNIMKNLKEITTLHELCEYARKNGLKVGGLKKYWFGVSIFDKTGDYFYTAQRSESQEYKKIKIQFDECFLKENLDNLNI